MNDTFDPDEALEREVAALLRREAAVGESASLGFSAADVASRRRRFAADQMRRRVLLGAVAAVSIAAIAVPLSLGAGRHGSSPPPVVSPVKSPVDTAATPPGWATVTFGNGQISVPATWGVTVTTRVLSGCGLNPNLVLVSEEPFAFLAQRPNCRLGQNNVFTAPVPRVGPPLHGTMLVNGIRVDLGGPVSGGESYVVPTFRTELLATGPLARKILGTLTYSPRTFVLSKARAPVPQGWASYVFGGIRFSAPGGWTLARDSWAGGCPYGLVADTVQLSTALTFVAPGCPLSPPPAVSEVARYGVVVAAGPTVRAIGVNPRQCLDLNGMRACSAEYAGTSFAGQNHNGVLTLSVTVPGQPRPVVVEIGLGGSGTTALAILDSIRPVQ